MIFVVYKEEFMKKSKIIIPALGILVLSTAASITGTVAWFTAQNTFNTTVGEFAVIKTNGDLECVQTAGFGTSVADNVVTNKANYVLSDGSFDHSAKKIIAPDRAGSKVGKNIALASATEDTNATTGLVRAVKDSKTALTVMTWQMQFKMDFGAEGTDSSYGLYMDHSASKSVVEKKDGSSWTTTIGENDTAHGFRLAFVGVEANAKTRVWADHQSSANCHFIDGGATKGAALASPNVDDYSSPDLMDSSCTLGIPTSAQATATAAGTANYLGKFAFTANSTVTLTYTVVAWFEGTDPIVVNNKNLDTVRAQLYFEVAPLSD